MDISHCATLFLRFFQRHDALARILVRNPYSSQPFVRLDDVTKRYLRLARQSRLKKWLKKAVKNKDFLEFACHGQDLKSKPVIKKLVDSLDRIFQERDAIFLEMETSTVAQEKEHESSASDEEPGGARGEKDPACERALKFVAAIEKLYPLEGNDLPLNAPWIALRFCMEVDMVTASTVVISELFTNHFQEEFSVTQIVGGNGKWAEVHGSPLMGPEEIKEKNEREQEHPSPVVTVQATPLLSDRPGWCSGDDGGLRMMIVIVVIMAFAIALLITNAATGNGRF